MVTYNEALKNRYVPYEAFRVDVRREGRSWQGEEFELSYFAMPEKMEACDGMLYCSDVDRLKVLAALLENIGADRAVRIGNPDVWRAAVAALDEPGG